MSLRRKAEVVLFYLAGAAQLALGWHYQSVDYSFFRHHDWPYVTLFTAGSFLWAALCSGTKWKIQAIVYAKVIAVLFLLLLWESVGTVPELAQVFPPLLVLCLRNDLLSDETGSLID